MTSIQTCKLCLYQKTHPLGLTFNEDGVCSGCSIHDEKNTLDWDHRWKRLEGLVNTYRLASGKNYDCVVPVTSANDSYYIVHLVKERLGLNPLLVAYNKYFNTPVGIKNLANLRIRFNCDLMIQNVNPISVKKITKSTLINFGSIYWPCLAGHSVFPVQIAVRFKIPLIIWGAHQGLEQVGMFSHEHEVEMTRRYRKDHDLMGYEADDLLSNFDTLREHDIWQYRYPDDKALQQIGVRGIYLGNYVRWDPKVQHEKMIQKYGYLTTKFSRTFDTYDHTDCYNFMDLHDYLKLVKHGYSKVTDHATREIRHGRLTRAQGMYLVQKYSKGELKHLDKFCDWLGIDIKSLNFIINQHRNPVFWYEFSPGEWKCKKKCKIIDETPISIDFSVNSSFGPEFDNTYTTIGKGWP